MDNTELRETLKRLRGKGAPHRENTEENVREAMRRMPGRKASGMDVWKAEELKQMPKEAMGMLADLLNLVEKKEGGRRRGRGQKLFSCPRARAWRPSTRGQLASSQ